MWGPSVWVKINSEICVSVEVFILSEECATSLFLCQGSLRFLLGKAANLWEQLKCLEKLLLFRRQEWSVPFMLQSTWLLVQSRACIVSCSGIMSVFWGSDKVCIQSHGSERKNLKVPYSVHSTISSLVSAWTSLVYRNLLLLKGLLYHLCRADYWNVLPFP